ncbi:Cyclic pyranopterin monophosphate synthase [Candidatus Terasakiella magnetica]|uniref:GTP 3',8-cyclase n=1 Tax=Candidatus Terasakiella magnetica TaxID=1867952 RepID=A0A1C3RHQ6_9PROT|nr:GTP 3',8-cyclase MoaA [Candidatus Terasakiella magnetica]SCA56810.1 Cyclic pyranopterin monophosphate synthase [Candidatus Terasakiella magnetica]
MKDTFGRTITYLRVSITDRCDFRCTYCMAEDMTFLPRQEILSFEEMERICTAFINRGVTKIRLTGGEPLVRRGVMDLIKQLSRHLETGALKELTLTTNGSQLTKYADDLVKYGVRRINVSLDTLDAQRFADITRHGKLDTVLNGLEAAKKAGLKVKINTVALKGQTDEELDDLLEFVGDNGFDLTFIETMPLGEIGGSRVDHYLPLTEVRERISKRWTISDTDYVTGGPARFVDVAETGNRIGFITPLSHGFCESCNRMRLTCKGVLYMCLGQDGNVDLREVVRSSESNEPLQAAIDKALNLKPEGHEFIIEEGRDGPALNRHMSVTGG